MGGGSSSPRTVTVTQDETNVVTISEDVARRLLGRPELHRSKLSAGSDEQRRITYKQQSSTFQEDLDFLDSHYKQRIRSLEKQNDQLQKKNDQALAATVKEFEEKFIKHKFGELICPELQNAVEKCYAANPGNSLACVQEVRDFKNCVQKHRQAIFSTRG